MEIVNGRFSVEISSGFDKFWCYNIAVTCGCFDGDGKRTGFASAEDTVADVGANMQAPPAGYRTPRTVTFETEPCSRLLMYIYIIPHTLPADNDIAESKPFNLKVRVSRDGERVFERTYTINRWSGASLELSIPPEE